MLLLSINTSNLRFISMLEYFLIFTFPNSFYVLLTSMTVTAIPSGALIAIVSIVSFIGVPTSQVSLIYTVDWLT